MKTPLLPLLTFGFLALAPLRAQEPEHIRDVIYTKHDGVALTMDTFRPAKPNGAGIIKIISGGWKSNHQGITDGGWPKAGYTTFVVVHGSQPRFQVEEIVADLNRAVRFVRAHASDYGVDPLKLAIPTDAAKKQAAESILERNAIAARLMQQHGITIDDLFTFITPHLATAQNPNDVHFTGPGYQMLGQQVAASIAAALRKKGP
jgi:hypothetical protein